jgi:hypothetical protein
MAYAKREKIVSFPFYERERESKKYRKRVKNIEKNI